MTSMAQASPTERGWPYAVMAFTAFFLLAADVLSLFAGKLFDGRPLSDPATFGHHWYATVGTFLCSVTLWTAAALVITWWLKRRGALGSVFTGAWDRRILLALCATVVVLAVVKWVEALGGGEIVTSVAREYRGFERRYPGFGILVTSFQFLYYLLESVMVVLILGLWQRAGEIWTGVTKVPWGGIGLTLTWGAAHFLSHPDGALTVAVTALVFGVGFRAVRKSALPAVALVWLMFFL